MACSFVLYQQPPARHDKTRRLGAFCRVWLSVGAVPLPRPRIRYARLILFYLSILLTTLPVPPLPNAKGTPKWACLLCSAAFPSTRHVNTPCSRVLRVWQCPPCPSCPEHQRHAHLGVSFLFGALLSHPDT